MEYEPLVPFLVADIYEIHILFKMCLLNQEIDFIFEGGEGERSSNLFWNCIKLYGAFHPSLVF